MDAAGNAGEDQLGCLEGDKITHNIYVLIDKTFVTPLDKEDIANLTGEIDQIIDYTDRL
jgi:uncharacterized protein Yka (UPF0111/DUF47 family)